MNVKRRTSGVTLRICCARKTTSDGSVATSPTTRNLGRISEIAQVAVKHGFGYFFETHRLTDLLPGRQRVTLEGSPSERGQHLREMLDELGPTFVKFGQLLSTRPDLVPLELGSWHTLKITVRGTALKTWLDDKPMLDYTLPAPVSGKIGVWSKADSVVYFDDYRVTPAPHS